MFNITDHGITQSPTHPPDMHRVTYEAHTQRLVSMVRLPASVKALINLFIKGTAVYYIVREDWPFPGTLVLDDGPLLETNMAEPYERPAGEAETVAAQIRWCAKGLTNGPHTLAVSAYRVRHYGMLGEIV